MACISSNTPSMDRNSRRPVAWGMIWKKELKEMTLFPLNDKLMGEDFERSR